MGHSFTHYVYDNNATYDDDGTETAQCDHGCGSASIVRHLRNVRIFL